MDICYFLICLFVGVKVGYTKTCLKPQSLNGKEVVIYFCCHPFVEKQTGCGCPPGTKTTVNKDCEPCQRGFYGDHCSLSCLCGKHEVCNPVLGCINTVTLEVTTGTNQKQQTTEQAPTSRSKRGVLTESDMYIWIGVISGGVIFIAILAVSGVSLCIKHKYTKTFAKTEPSNILENHCESAYDVIDENNMKDNFPPIINAPTNLPPRENITNESTNGGYLDPFHHPCHANDDCDVDDSSLMKPTDNNRQVITLTQRDRNINTHENEDYLEPISRTGRKHLDKSIFETGTNIQQNQEYQDI